MDEICRLLSALGITPVPLWPEGVWCEIDGTEIEIHTDSEHSFTYVTTPYPPGKSRHDLSPEGLNAANNAEPVAAHTRDGLRLCLIGTPTRDTLQWALATITRERNGTTTIPLPEVPPIEEQRLRVGAALCGRTKYSSADTRELLEALKGKDLEVFPHHIQLDHLEGEGIREWYDPVAVARWVAEQNCHFPLGFFTFDVDDTFMWKGLTIAIPLTADLSLTELSHQIEIANTWFDTADRMFKKEFWD